MASLITYRKQLEKLIEKRNQLVRAGKLIQSYALNDDIKKVEALIKQAEDYEAATRPKPVSELITREQINKSGIIPLMIECHLISDMLVEVAYMIVDKCKEVGLEGVSFMSDLTDAIKANEKFASFLTKIKDDTDGELLNLLTRNETLNQALHKKYISYMNQRLTSKK